MSRHDGGQCACGAKRLGWQRWLLFFAAVILLNSISVWILLTFVR